MKRFRLPVALTGAVCALAVTAAPALAEGFKTTGGTTSGKGESVLTFKFGSAKSIKVECASYKSTGTAVAGTPNSILDVVTPKKCEYLKHPVKFESPLEIEYLNPATISEESNENNVILKSSTTLKIAALKCYLTIDEQSLPKEETAIKHHAAATYEDAITYFTKKKQLEEFPEGQTKLIINNKWSELEWETEAVKEEHGLCAELEEPSGENGTFTGEFKDEIKGGNLGV